MTTLKPDGPHVTHYDATVEETVNVPLAALEWLFGGDTGLSSKCIWRTMTGVPEPKTHAGAYPRDISDFGRCVQLLEKLPQWKGRLGEMRRHGAVWSALVDEWETLAALSITAERAVESWPMQLTPEKLAFHGAIRQCTESARKGEAHVTTTILNLDGPHVTHYDATASPVVTRSWMTPRQLDVERTTYRRMKPQHGGWNQALWLVLQDTWRRAMKGGS